MEDKLFKEKIKRAINKMYDEKDIDSMHEISHMLLEGMYQQKIGMYYFREEAMNNLVK
tara:strand:+ start:3372 stop:3545 length:174 start_codon:yes stop_codon:yes gene_type:complete